MIKIEIADALDWLKTLPDEYCQTCITSPPYYGLRDYNVQGQLGAEPTIAEYLDKLTTIFSEVKRVLKADGTLWLNMGDSFAHSGKCGGSSPVGERKGREADRSMQVKCDYKIPIGLKAKDMLGMPWRLAFKLQESGWYLRSDIIWHKPNPVPESVRDRPVKSHEYLFLLSKSPKYYYDWKAIVEPAKTAGQVGGFVAYQENAIGQEPTEKEAIRRKNYVRLPYKLKRDVWTITPERYKGAHFATFPTKLVEPCLLAGSRVGDICIDPFSGSGTVGVVCLRQGRSFHGSELNPEYAEMAKIRLACPDIRSKNV